MLKRKARVFVGMSGGVDSSVAAALLKKQGYEVIGVHLKCYNVDGCAEQDAEDVRRAAETLNIRFYTFDFEKEYKERVVRYMVDGYRNGITPNPDVMCNKEIKFGLFLEKALEMGADYVATGHYVRLVKQKNPYSLNPLRSPSGSLASVVASPLAKESRKRADHAEATPEVSRNKDFSAFYRLYQAKDKNKDQSYFLWTLTQKQLRYCLFPIGEYVKLEVRKLARKFGLPNADKKDSQGICFLGQVTLADFLSEYIPQKKGIIVNTVGKIVGEHKGAALYTIGQRHGLGIAGKKPYYVAEKDTEENAILVAEGGDNPLLFRKEINLANINLVNKGLVMSGRKVFARVRYRQPLSAAALVLNGGRGKLVFEKPQKFVAAGQSAVFYDQSGAMIGGGVIV